MISNSPSNYSTFLIRFESEYKLHCLFYKAIGVETKPNQGRSLQFVNVDVQQHLVQYTELVHVVVRCRCTYSMYKPVPLFGVHIDVCTMLAYCASICHDMLHGYSVRTKKHTSPLSCLFG